MRSPRTKVRERARPRSHSHEKSESMKRDALDTLLLQPRDNCEDVRVVSALLASVVMAAGSISAFGDAAQPTRGLRVNAPAADSTVIVTISYTPDASNA